MFSIHVYVMYKSTTRTKYYPVGPDYSLTYYKVSGPSPQSSVAHGYSGCPFTDYYERYTPNSDGSREFWKPFLHFKSVRGDIPVLNGTIVAHLGDDFMSLYRGANMDPYYGVSNFLFGDVGRNDKDLPAYETVTQVDGDFIPDPPDLDGLKARSLKVMLPIIKSELSLLNSIIELKDFKSLPRLITSFEQYGRKGYKSLRDTLRLGSENYLQAEFNFLPLLSDITGLRTALSRTEKRMNALISRSGGKQSKHFSFVFTADKDINEGTSRILWTDTSWPSGHIMYQTLRRIVINEPAVFHAQIEYNYNYTQYQVEHARLLALLDAVGINFNPQIIWNAIPWTFVVDWVFGVSQWLGQFKEENMKPTINIHRYLWSYKRKRQILVSKKLEHGAGFSPKYSEVPLPAVFQSAYKREVGVPTASSIQSSGLNLKEFSLGAALVFSRRRRQRR